jgi:hypothetical protein
VQKWWGRYPPFISTMFGSGVTGRWLLVISAEMCFFSTQKRNCYFSQKERSQTVPVMLFLFPIHQLVGVGTRSFWLPCMVQELWLTQKCWIMAVTMVTAYFQPPVKPEPYIIDRKLWYLPPLIHVWGTRITSLELSATFCFGQNSNFAFECWKSTFRRK